MKRDFLEALGLEKETVDKIMAENGTDLEREKAKTTAARADLADAQGKLSAAQTELEGLNKAGGVIAAIDGNTGTGNEANGGSHVPITI